MKRIVNQRRTEARSKSHRDIEVSMLDCRRYDMFGDESSASQSFAGGSGSFLSVAETGLVQCNCIAMWYYCDVV